MILGTLAAGPALLGRSGGSSAGLGAAFVQLTAATGGVTGRDAGLAGGLVNITTALGMSTYKRLRHSR